MCCCEKKSIFFAFLYHVMHWMKGWNVRKNTKIKNSSTWYLKWSYLIEKNKLSHAHRINTGYWIKYEMNSKLLIRLGIVNEKSGGKEEVKTQRTISNNSHNYSHHANDLFSPFCHLFHSSHDWRVNSFFSLLCINSHTNSHCCRDCQVMLYTRK
jgi:hypothetical protein